MSFRADGGAEEAGGTPPKGVQRSSAWKQRIFRRLCLAYEWAWRRCRCWCRCWQLAQWFLLSIVGVHFRRSFCLDTGACRGCVGGLGACVCSACGADAFPCWLQAERATIQKTLLHAADISNPCKPWEVSKNWSDRVIEEFFAQGDREKEAGLVVSANMDRDTTHPARVAVNFTDFIVAPMFVALTSLLPPAQSCCDLLGESPLLLDARHGCACQLTPAVLAWTQMRTAHSGRRCSRKTSRPRRRCPTKHVPTSWRRWSAGPLPSTMCS